MREFISGLLFSLSVSQEENIGESAMTPKGRLEDRILIDSGINVPILPILKRSYSIVLLAMTCISFTLTACGTLQNDHRWGEDAIHPTMAAKDTWRITD